MMLPRDHWRLAGAALATGAALFLARRRLRQLLSSFQSSSRTEPWELADLPIARYSADYLFVYKQQVRVDLRPEYAMQTSKPVDELPGRATAWPSLANLTEESR